MTTTLENKEQDKAKKGDTKELDLNELKKSLAQEEAELERLKRLVSHLPVGAVEALRVLSYMQSLLYSYYTLCDFGCKGNKNNSICRKNE